MVPDIQLSSAASPEITSFLQDSIIDTVTLTAKFAVANLTEVNGSRRLGDDDDDDLNWEESVWMVWSSCSLDSSQGGGVGGEVRSVRACRAFRALSAVVT
ncbi:hypothetical protein F7725_027420 [Dissostichus mawsoni]|uniref:Uncharacterized protein n=1 Tax=Dissostichus mawsoni TaxID=36200 RepID=A0A7J5XCU7_DISMA|nr:hypothetical protein F7725_027420 [Dissostichus mawsoni]